MQTIAMITSAIGLTIPITKLCPEKVRWKELVPFFLILLTFMLTLAKFGELFIPIASVICTFSLINFKLKNIFLSFILSIFNLMIALVTDYLSSVILILILKINMPVFLGDKSNFYWFSFITILSCFGISSAVGYILNKKIAIENIHFVGTQPFVMCGFTLGNIIMFYSLTIIGKQYGLSNLYILINGTMIPLYFLITMIIIFYLFVSSNKDSELKYKDELLRNVTSYSIQLEEMYSSLRRFRHDHSNIMLSMSMYIIDKEYDKLEEFFFKTISSAGQGLLSDSFHWDSLQNLKVIEIKGIIASKSVLAQEKNIIFSVEIPEEITQVYMNVLDLNIIIGILLDNAIEASLLCEKPRIRIGIMKKENAIIVIIINNFCNNNLDINTLFDEGVSSKGDGRGLGLFNLKSILKKYDDVFLDISTDNKEFKVVLEIENEDR